MSDLINQSVGAVGIVNSVIIPEATQSSIVDMVDSITDEIHILTVMINGIGAIEINTDSAHAIQLQNKRMTEKLNNLISVLFTDIVNK